MPRNVSLRLPAALAAALLGGAAIAGGPPAAHCHMCPPACEPGYTVVEEICYKNVERKVCKAVPDVQKVTKWVYDCATEDFCLPKCDHPWHRCGKHGCEPCPSCPQCDRPMCKTNLIKKAVVEERPITKCVVETVVEVVPYKVYRKVPCGTVLPPPYLPPHEAIAAPKPAGTAAPAPPR